MMSKKIGRLIGLAARFAFRQKTLDAAVMVLVYWELFVWNSPLYAVIFLTSYWAIDIASSVREIAEIFKKHDG